MNDYQEHVESEVTLLKQKAELLSIFGGAIAVLVIGAVIAAIPVVVVLYRWGF